MKLQFIYCNYFRIFVDSTMTTENLVSVSDIDRENFTNGVGTDDYPQITTSAKPETNGTDFYIRFRMIINVKLKHPNLLKLSLIQYMYFSESEPKLPFEWICGSCHDHAGNLPPDQYGRTWGHYEDSIYNACEGCKEKCNKDENCAGVECYEKIRLFRTFGFHSSVNTLNSCTWRKNRIMNECVSTSNDYFTCWKEHKSE